MMGKTRFNKFPQLSFQVQHDHVELDVLLVKLATLHII